MGFSTSKFLALNPCSSGGSEQTQAERETNFAAKIESFRVRLFVMTGFFRLFNLNLVLFL